MTDNDQTNDQASANDRPEEPRDPAEARGARPKRFLRSRDDRVIAGVAGGLGRYFNVDPIFFRIGAVALAVFGGVGFFLYGAAWLLVPVERAPGEPPEPAAPARRRALTIAGAIILAISATSLIGHSWGDWWDGGWWWGGFFGPLVLLVVGGVVLWRVIEGRGDPSDAGRILARIALVVAALAAAAIVFVASAWATAAGGGAVVAGIVIALGALLVIAAFTGGARWLILPALALAVPAGVVSAADIKLDGGIGERNYRPASIVELRDAYKLGAGRIEIDLRDLKLPPGEHKLKIDLGVGQAAVDVPRDVCVATDAHVGAGYARVFDRDSGGLDMDWGTAPPSKPSVPRLVLDAHVGMGALEVVHDPGDVDGFDRYGDRGLGGGGNDACNA